MKISTRLSVTFSIIASAIILAFGITVYALFYKYREHNFHERLKERIEITEKIFLEKETFSPDEFEKITNQFLRTLPQETEEVIELKEGEMPVFKHRYPEDVREKLVKNDLYVFNYDDVEGISKVFHIKGKDYLVIVTAVDKTGLQFLDYLRNIIILLILIGIPQIFIGSFIIAKRAMLPISKKIDKANSISASSLHQRLNVYNPNDELGKMAIAFNKLLDRLEASFEAQKSFLRNASHEIRNPLTAIMGEAEIAMSKSRTKEEYVESLKTILSGAETLNATVNNLLQLSKVTANEEGIHYEILHFDDFLMEIKESFDFQNPDNKVRITIENTDGGSSFQVRGNRNLLKTAIINIFDNACKFSSNKDVEVALKKDARKLMLSVRDQGIGISDKDIEQIKTPFYRGQNAMRIKGSGIGLSLSSKIITHHHGSLEIHSQIDKGTLVIITLPLISTTE